MDQQSGSEFPSVGQYRKGCGQYIPALTSQSVDKSIIVYFKAKHPISLPGRPQNLDDHVRIDLFGSKRRFVMSGQCPGGWALA